MSKANRVMNIPSNPIDALVADLAPVRRVTPRTGVLVVLGGVLLELAVTVPIFGLRPDVAAFQPREIVLLRSGALLLMGMAAAWAVIAASSPGVGTRRDGWRWAVGAGLLFPATSLLLSLGGAGFPGGVLTASSAKWCLGISLSSALVIGALLTAWLRRGAVTEANRVGGLTGLAAGSLGTFVYSLHCPSNSVHYAALWYGLVVVIAVVAGRVFVPRFLRW